jgi:hypothetical protein
VHSKALIFFLKNASANPGAKVLSTCISCRDRKRSALQRSGPSKRRADGRATFGTFEPPFNASTFICAPSARTTSTIGPSTYNSATYACIASARITSPLIGPSTLYSLTIFWLPPSRTMGAHTEFSYGQREGSDGGLWPLQGTVVLMALRGGICHASFLRDKGIRRPFSWPQITTWTRESFQPIWQSCPRSRR